jgi:hypothetical protein
MRKTLFWLLIFLGVMVTFRCCKSGRTVMVLRRGDNYADRVGVIKNEFCFLFRIKIDCDIYNVFGHRDTYDVLIFKDGRLEYIGKDIDRRIVCSEFFERNSGKVYKQWKLGLTCFPLQVTHFSVAGQTSLKSGMWVMTGGKSIRNWIMAGGLQKIGVWKYSITDIVNKSSLLWPSGWEWIKGIFGQRVIK